LVSGAALVQPKSASQQGVILKGEPMIIYEVTLEVQNQILDTYRPWLRKHIAEMIALPYFDEAEAFTVETQSKETTTFTIFYQAKSKAELEEYFEKDAVRMRQDGLNKFGDKFTASRRILSPFN
jgi:hypothetical protein